MTDRITLISLEIEAFKSFRAVTKIAFDDVAGLNFLTGKNEVEPRMGANGAGKTSVGDALNWCLYGASALGDRAGELATWGMKRPRVIATFDISGDVMAIERQGSPDRLAINGTAATQAEVDSMMGLHRARFAQAVLFGQGVPFFLDLPVPARGALLDEALDLTIWHKAAATAKAADGVLRADAEDVQRALSYELGRSDALPNLDELERLSNEWRAEADARIELAVQAAENAEGRRDALAAHADKLRASYAKAAKPDEATVRAARKELDGLRSKRDALVGGLDHQRRHAKIHRDGTKSCPTCGQNIDAAHSKQVLHELDMQEIDSKITIDELESAMKRGAATLERAVQMAARITQSLQRLAEDGREAVARVDAATRELERAEAAAAKMLDAPDTNPFAAQIANAKMDAKAIEKACADLHENAAKIAGQIIINDYWKSAFTRVRLFVIKRILAHLEIEVANAASLLGLVGWTIEFKTETETKSGTLKSGIQVQVRSAASPGAWTLWSGGEGQRIRIAVQMGLANMLQRLSGVDYAFEIWDEPSGYLSDEGIDDLLECLRHRARTSGKAIWLIDHRTYSYAFDKSWVVVKTAAGSYIDQEGKAA